MDSSEDTSEIAGIHADGEYEEDEEDIVEPVRVDSTKFTPLKECKFILEENGKCSYSESNDFVTLSCIEETPAAFRMEMDVGLIDKSFESLDLIFKTGDTKQTVRLEYVEPCSCYSVIIDRNDSDSFQLIDAKWKTGTFRIDGRQEFDNRIKVSGYNTLKWYGVNKTILICRKDGTIIGSEHLKGFGSKAINFGAYYYLEVI